MSLKLEMILFMETQLMWSPQAARLSVRLGRRPVKLLLPAVIHDKATIPLT